MFQAQFPPVKKVFGQNHVAEVSAQATFQQTFSQKKSRKNHTSPKVIKKRLSPTEHSRRTLFGSKSKPQKTIKSKSDQKILPCRRISSISPSTVTGHVPGTISTREKVLDKKKTCRRSLSTSIFPAHFSKKKNPEKITQVQK
jgi:hypothetical protein